MNAKWHEKHVLRRGASLEERIAWHPGIRPSEINRRLKMVQSDALRDTLIGRGLVRKVKEGRATHLYAK